MGHRRRGTQNKQVSPGFLLHIGGIDECAFTAFPENQVLRLQLLQCQTQRIARNPESPRIRNLRGELKSGSAAHVIFSNRNPAAGRKFNGPYRYAVLRENRQRKQYLSAGIDPEPVILRGTLIDLTKNFTEIADSIEPAHLCDFFHREIGVQQQLPDGIYECIRQEHTRMSS